MAKSVYDVLALTDEQRAIMKELHEVQQKAIKAGLYLVCADGYGVFAYNAKRVNCFDAPEDAAYDTDRIKVDITKLERYSTYQCYDWSTDRMVDVVLDDDLQNL